MIFESEHFVGDTRLTKELRKKEIRETGLLDENRFILSDHPIIVERLTKLKKSLIKLKSEHPRFITLGLRGSYVKGYAAEESDIEGTIFIDAEGRNLTNEHVNESFATKYRGYVVRELIDSLSINEALLRDLHVMLVTKQGLIEMIENIDIDMEHALEDIHLLFTLSPGSENSPDLVSVTSEDLNVYRKLVLDQLELEGELGEQKWKRIVYELHVFERSDIDHLERDGSIQENHRLYPTTISQARNYFLIR